MQSKEKGKKEKRKHVNSRLTVYSFLKQCSTNVHLSFLVKHNTADQTDKCVCIYTVCASNQ